MRFAVSYWYKECCMMTVNYTKEFSGWHMSVRVSRRRQRCVIWAAKQPFTEEDEAMLTLIVMHITCDVYVIEYHLEQDCCVQSGADTHRRSQRTIYITSRGDA